MEIELSDSPCAYIGLTSSLISLKAGYKWYLNIWELFDQIWN